MNNPGLSVFAAPTMFKERPSTHPIWHDVRPGNVDYDPDHDEDPSDYVPPVDFGRWRNPGQSLRVPVRQGPPFAHGETPEDVIHGEVVSPAEQDGADKILNGEHESDSPSANPYVEHARRELHTSASTDAVSTLSGLLSGGSPADVGGVDEAHDYLSRHFTGVRVNPRHGTLLAASPAGIQTVKRLAISDRPAVNAPPSYSLTNKHGVFESKDPQKLVRAMLAFQILHNELAQKKKSDDKDDDGGLTSTSGIRDWMGMDRPSTSGPISWKDALLRRTNSPPPKAPNLPAPSAVFEPGHGTDKNDFGVHGGYVADDHDAPSHWRRDSSGVAYSPGHFVNEILNPAKATKPRSDPRYPNSGHTLTYAPNTDTGHIIERHGGGAKYFVTGLHPAVRGGFDLPPVLKPPKPVKPPKPAKAAPAKAAPSQRMPRMPRRTGPVPPVPPPPPLPPTTSSVKANDLCPVCVSGYLEPYDSDTHECLNCGSLVKHVGFDKQASKKPPRGGLGRGLGQILQPEGDPLNLASGGSENPDNMDDVPLPGESVHPLADEKIDPEYIGYEAPRDIFNKTAGEADPLDEQLGKHGYFPIHKPGEERAYLAEMPGTPGAYARLTEGVHGNNRWVLTADHVPAREQWTNTETGKPHRKRDMTFQNLVPGEPKAYAYLPDASNRVMGEKSILAIGHHPIDDDSLNRALRDVSQHGRNSQTYQKAVLDTAYEPPKLPPEHGTQRQKRLLSSVNPGLARFAERDPYLPIAFSYESEPAHYAFDDEDRDDLAELGLRRTVDPGNRERLNPSNDALIDFKHMDDAGGQMESTKRYSPCATCWHSDGDDGARFKTHFEIPGHVPMEDTSSERLASARFSD